MWRRMGGLDSRIKTCKSVGQNDAEQISQQFGVMKCNFPSLRDLLKTNAENSMPFIHKVLASTYLSSSVTLG